MPERLPVALAVSISSAASLGAYEAGAAAALVTALQRVNAQSAAAGVPPPVRVDAIGATSAGSLVGLLAARCLLAGLDPVAVLEQAWVEGAAARTLAEGADAPLSLEPLNRRMPGLLDPRDDDGRPLHRVEGAAREPVALAVWLGSLRALTYRIPRATASTPLHAMTHVDWAEYVLARHLCRRGHGAELVRRWLGAALQSARAHAGRGPPTRFAGAALASDGAVAMTCGGTARRVTGVLNRATGRSNPGDSADEGGLMRRIVLRAVGGGLGAGLLALSLSACSAEVDTGGDGVRVDVDVTSTPNLPDVDLDPPSQ